MEKTLSCCPTCGQELSVQYDRRRRVLELLKEKPMTASEVAEALGVSEESSRYLLNRMHRSRQYGIVSQYGDPYGEGRKNRYYGFPKGVAS